LYIYVILKQLEMSHRLVYVAELLKKKERKAQSLGLDGDDKCPHKKASAHARAHTRARAGLPAKLYAYN